MKKIDALNDLSTLTTIPYSNLQKLFYRLGTIIAYDVQESLRENEQIISIHLGFGVLNILVTEEDVSYKFIPTSAFEQELIDAVINHDIALVNDIEDSLKNKIVNAYKDLF